jgi:hypothetical protein
MAKSDDMIKVLRQLASANLGNPPANMPEFLMLAAKALNDLPIQAVEDGIQTIVMDSEFFPRIATLRRAATAAKLAGHGKVHAAPELIVSSALQKGTAQTFAGGKDTHFDFLGNEKLQAFAEGIDFTEWKCPDDWTEEDYQKFEALMGRRPDWENDNENAPWMWWKGLGQA